jgi:tartrate-resistant acid phosphatase type 5
VLVRNLLTPLCFFLTLGCGSRPNAVAWIAPKDFSAFQSAGTDACIVYSEESVVAKTACSDLGPEAQKITTICRKFGKSTRIRFPKHGGELRPCEESPQTLRLRDNEVVRVLAFADAGRGEMPEKGYRQLSVAHAMHTVCADRGGCDFALVAGDLIYPAGIADIWDPKLQRSFVDPYRRFEKMPFFLVAGNHDHQGNVIALQEYGLRNSSWRMPDLSFVVPNLPPWLSITGIDSQLWAGETTMPSALASQALARQNSLFPQDRCNQNSWRVIFGHFPAYSHGHHPINESAKHELLSRTANCPPHLYISGHNHLQEFITTKQTAFIIQGAGGASLQSGESDSTPLADGATQEFIASRHGFALLEFRDQSLNVEFFDVTSWIDQDFNDNPPVIFRKMLHRDTWGNNVAQ